MQTIRVTKTQVFEEMRDIIKTSLPQIFGFRELEQLVKVLSESYGVELSTRMKKRLLAEPSEIRTLWNRHVQKNMLTYRPEQIDIIDVLAFWSRQPGSSLSHSSALYFHNLIEQRPSSFFITQEVKSKIHARSETLDDFAVRQAFLKPSRISENHFMCMKSTIYLLEKVDLNRAGVEEKEISFGDRAVVTFVTNIERTFIDSVIAPHYSGGVQTILSAFQDVAIDGTQLLYLYDKINPTYPYWQSIGFLLELLGNEKPLSMWESKWGDHKRMNFYIDRQAKPTWIKSSKWNVFYPQELNKYARN